MKKLILINLVFLASVVSFAQQKNQNYLNYIEQYKKIAIQEMERYGIPASITLAQGIFESGGGRSELTLESNNHFGIKCQKSWTGERVYHDDDAKHECFRKYNSALESYEDHSKFLKNNVRYASLFKLSKTDYKGWAYGLKQAGYATNPQYAPRLIKLIEEYELYKLDTQNSTEITSSKTTMPDSKKDSKSSEKVKKNKKEKKNGGFWSFFRKKRTLDSTEIEQNKVFEEGKYMAEITPYRTHEIKKINGVKCVIALSGDTYASIADEFDMYEKELLKANEVKFGAEIKDGDIVYLAKKKKVSKEESKYVVQVGETVYQISQKKGIRVRNLYKLNNLIYGKQVSEGDVIKLR